VEPLLRRLDDKDAAVRAAAHALLRRGTAKDFGYDAAASSDDRQAAVTKWQAWWLSVKDKLVYDPATKQLAAP